MKITVNTPLTEKLPMWRNLKVGDIYLGGGWDGKASPTCLYVKVGDEHRLDLVTGVVQVQVYKNRHVIKVSIDSVEIRKA
jgi:hypothetical protein